MRVNGLTLTYEGGVNTMLGHPDSRFPVGDLLCRIFQGETLYNISRIVRNCIGMCPMRDNALTQDEIDPAAEMIRGKSVSIRIL